MLFHAPQHHLIIAEAVTDLLRGSITFLHWSALGAASAEAQAQELCDRTQTGVLGTQDSNPDGSHPAHQAQELQFGTNRKKSTTPERLRMLTFL